MGDLLPFNVFKLLLFWFFSVVWWWANAFVVYRLFHMLLSTCMKGKKQTFGVITIRHLTYCYGHCITRKLNYNLIQGYVVPGHIIMLYQTCGVTWLSRVRVQVSLVSHFGAGGILIQASWTVYTTSPGVCDGIVSRFMQFFLFR